MDQPPPPSSWAFASPDGNVLLVGALAVPTTGPLVDGAQFELAPGGLYIAYPSLVTITSTPTSQTLRSLNTGTAILSLAIDPSSAVYSPSSTSSTVVTLHTPLIIPRELNRIRQSSLWSKAFNILIDGPSFPLPHFDPSSLASLLASPFLGPSVLSPTLNRALLSPMLSPQRRAHSTGSDASVPPLNLGLSRTRRSSSLSRPPTLSTGLSALVPPATPDALSSIVHDGITSHAKQTAEDIMVLRRAHDAFVARTKAELDVLEARVRAGVSAPGANGPVVVRGFGTTAKSPSTSRERGGSLERSPLGLPDGERGRSRDVGPARDEAASRAINEVDRAEDEARGRSRSRTRRGEAPGVPAPGLDVQATVDDERAREIPGRSDDTPAIATSFVPASHALVSIPESEELALPSPEPQPEPEPVEEVKLNGANGHGASNEPDEDGDSAEEDAPFDMDEDIEIDDLALPPRADSPPLADVAPLPIASATPPVSMSFRRPSVLSSSYAGLLANSLAKNPPVQQYRPTPASPTPHSIALPPSFQGGFSSTPAPPDFGSRLPESPPGTPHGAQSSVRDDITIASTYVDPPSLEARRQGELQMRRALALDAPSHRAPLPLRRRQPVRVVEPDASSESESEQDLPALFVVGSLPISIGPPPARLRSAVPERELLRKTSVPAREAMFVPPLPIRAPAPLEPPATGTGSLAQSLRNPPATFGRREPPEREARPREPSGKEHEAKDGFVPPHVWREETMTDEEMLSRSIPRTHVGSRF